ncbi:hypothetical protein COB21_01590 [Candidatus Aerophobetes bacterium]|uniref:Leucine-rich repeat domain-containing protein n=1 Tax=Aerophobetes bacterium TaxID=2030807 RepID=A0A2A4X813_UNCAE|nr:MAG: hypothetical protein COB21_01590 [Candidatus Aerophobetes bacterium]
MTSIVHATTNTTTPTTAKQKNKKNVVTTTQLLSVNINPLNRGKRARPLTKASEEKSCAAMSAATSGVFSAVPAREHNAASTKRVRRIPSVLDLENFNIRDFKDQPIDLDDQIMRSPAKVRVWAQDPNFNALRKTVASISVRPNAPGTEKDTIPSWIRFFPNIKYINLIGTNIFDLKSLCKLTKLGALFLDNTRVIDLGHLVELTELTILNLSNTLVDDIRPLSRCTRLEELNLSYTSVLSLSPLPTDLLDLNVSNTDVTDISALGELTKLRLLDISNTDVKNISPLSQCTCLEELDLSGTPVKDLSLLTQLSNLEILTLSKNQQQYFSKNLMQTLADRRTEVVWV